MEGSAFDQGVQDPGADPFGDDEGRGEFEEQREPFDAAVTQAVDPPIVDREGHPVSQDETQVQSDLGDSAGGEDPFGDPAATSGEPQGETAQSPAAQAAAAPATQPSPTTASATQSDDGSGSQVPASGTAKRRKAGEGEDRRREYLIFREEAPGKYAEVVWYEDKEGNIVAKGASGSKQVRSCTVHSAEQALAIGFQAIGSPSDGAAMVAVSARAFRVRQVAPRPVQPVRTHLDIR